MSEGHAARRLRIRGLVQGVGYRWSMLQQARHLGVDGWVRNRRDGSVEAAVAGPPLALEAMVAWAKRGPPGSSVASVEESLDFWKNVNRCNPTPHVKTFEDIEHQSFSGCRKGTAVELYTVIGGRHAWPGSDGPAWPGGDEPTQTISASALIWDFFSAHPKP